MSKNSASQIELFWKWFLKNENKIKEVVDGGSVNEKEALIEQLDNLILEMGMFKWELGPGEEKSFFFTISPNGNSDLLEISKSIMNSAPQLSDWELNFAKPVNFENLTFTVFDDFLNEYPLDASTWLFKLVVSSQHTVDIHISGSELMALDSENQLMACETALFNALGEDFKIKHVNELKIEKHFDPSLTQEPITVFNLKKEIQRTLLE